VCICILWSTFNDAETREDLLNLTLDRIGNALLHILHHLLPARFLLLLFRLQLCNIIFDILGPVYVYIIEPGHGTNTSHLSRTALAHEPALALLRLAPVEASPHVRAPNPPAPLPLAFVGAMPQPPAPRL
jgi:tRNA nucleotidyltransferase/poly(A) polymerase